MYEKLLDMNVLYESFQKCKRGVYWKASVQKYESNLLINLYKLRKSLEDGTYRQKPFDEFDICERGKQRHIKALHISDRVLQRALCDEILMPNIKKYLIYDNGANVKGKGIDFAKYRLYQHLRRFYINEGTNEGYILQMDISKYFDSIPHDKAYKVLTEHIDDERVKALVKYLISTFGDGVGIGSQISQLIGIFYIHKIDDYIKIVRSMKYYARYSDDIYIIHKDKVVLQNLLEELKLMFKQYGLSLNEKKTQIRKINRRFTYLKARYRLSDSGEVVILPSKDTIKRERQKLKSFAIKLENKEMTIEDIRLQYSSWRGNLMPKENKPNKIKYKCYNTIKRMDELYEQLFGRYEHE